MLLTISIAGLFTALQTKMIACGTKKMLLSLGIRFFLGPALMVISSYAIGMHGTLLKVAIIQVDSSPFICIVHSNTTGWASTTNVMLHLSSSAQAALPQGIVPFVFAKEYNVHADILSTA